MPNKSVTISIVTWNNEKTISQCLKSIFDQDYKNIEVFVYDNSSSDKTKIFLAEFTDKIDSLFSSDCNAGFCTGHNYNINASSGDFVLLVNPDIILSKNYISEACKAFEKEKMIGTVCGLLLRDDTDNSFIDSSGMNFNRYYRFSLKHHGEKIKNLNLNEGFVDGVDGALPLYKREMINSLKFNNKFFDELFFAHKEDWDISWRCNNLGWKNYFEPGAVALHPRSFKPNSLNIRRSMSKEIKYHAIKNQFILVIKNYRWRKDLKNVMWFFLKEILIFFYVLIFEQYSLKAYKYVFNNIDKILAKRKYYLGKERSHI